METRDVLMDAFGRIRELVHRALEGLDGAALAFRPEADANSIAWLVWHLTRVEDDHMSEIAGKEQAWMEWSERFDMPPDPSNTGYGHTSAEVGAFRPADPDGLAAYHDAVADRTLAYLSTIGTVELDRIIDRSWDPPVSVGVRIVSVIGDGLQHAGQAHYVRGILERSSG